MKIHISVSAVAFLKGQTVAVKIKNNEWYCGTIKAVGRTGGYTVLFNDGDKAKIDPADIKNIRPIVKKGKKAAYTYAEISTLFIKATPKVKPVTKRPSLVEDKPVITVRPKKVVKPKAQSHPTGPTVTVNGIPLYIKFEEHASNYGPAWDVILLDSFKGIEIRFKGLFDYMKGSNSFGTKFFYLGSPLFRYAEDGVETPTIPDLKDLQVINTFKALEAALNDTANRMWISKRSYFKNSVVLNDPHDLLGLKAALEYTSLSDTLRKRKNK